MYNFTPIAYPEGIEHPVQKRAGSRGYDIIGSRMVIGDVSHITRTGGQVEHLMALMDVGGSREQDLLVDAVIGRDGRLALPNGPLLTERPTRASWVNLGQDAGLSAPAAAFIARFGTTGLGRYLVSKAHIARAGQGLTDAQFETSARLSAAIHQQACCPWDRYPYNPLYDVSLSFWHCDFGSGICPGDAFQERWRQPLEDRVRALLQAAQTGVVEDRTPPIEELQIPVDPRYPAGWTEREARQHFGELRHYGPDGELEVLAFDPCHVICNEWLCQGWRDGDWPEALVWIRADTSWGERHDLVMFRGGRRLVRRGEDQPWRWERLHTRFSGTWEPEALHALGT